MLADVWKLWAICALAQLGTATAAAEALPLKKSLNLGRPARSIDVELSEAESAVVHVQGTALTLPARKIRSADLTSIAVASDAAVAILRISAENGEWVALLGGRSGKELLSVERSDWVGDPGERRATLVQHEPVAGAAYERVSVGMQHQGLARCGTGAAILSSPRSVDPKTLKLVASAITPAVRGSAIDPTPSSEATPPRLQLLRATGSSQLDELTKTPRLPSALTDQVAETAWTGSSGDLALLRWSAPDLAIERLELDVGARSAPVSLNLDIDGASFHLSLPKSGASRERLVVTLPADTKGSCVALEIAQASAPLAVAEVHAFSTLDRPDGIDRLVGDLVQDGARGALAAELLAELGEPAVRSVVARFGELSARGQRRALRVLGRYLALPECRARVLEAARSKDETLSQAAFDVLRQGKEPGREALRTLVVTADAAGDRAAQALAAQGSADAAGLFSALGSANGEDRPALRRALVSLARREPDAFRAAAQTWLGQGPSPSARIGLALVAVLSGLPDLATPLVEGNLSVTRFEDRFRLCLAAAQLGPSDAIDGWLAQQAREASEWMQRRAAYDALLLRGSDQARSLVSTIVKDPYPRVRAAAAEEFAREGQATPLTELARNDPWPLVRAAAAAGLGAVPNTASVLEGLLADSSRHVRVASIDGLLRQKHAGAWPRVAERLSAANEWPEVQAAAVRFASGLCVQAARPALAETARKALRPDANEDDRQLGLEAIRALHDLGGDAGNDARLIATREAASPQLQKAFASFGPARCQAQAATAAR